MLSIVKPQIEKYFEPLASALSGVNPNVLTLIGSIPPLLFFVFVVNGMYFLATIAFIGSLLDLLDGMVSRKQNKVTSFGGFLDSTMDRIGDFLTITAFSFAGIVRWEITAPVLLFSFLISYIRAQGGVRSEKRANFANGIGLIERTERYLLTIIALIFYAIFQNISLSGFNLAELIFLVLGALSLYTVYQRFRYAYKTL